MRCVPSPEFLAKTRIAPVNALILPSIGLLLTQLQARTFDALVSGLGQITLRPFKDDVYIAAHADVAIFARKTADASGEFLLLTDVVQNHLLNPAGLGSSKDPRSNPWLNPRINSAIDPHLNDSLDPNHNDKLNPKMNAALNPRQNSAINPRMNPDVNPKLNRAISPTAQLSLNPKHNATINPSKNSLFDGPFCYDLNLKKTGFFVPADSRVFLLFAMDLQFSGFTVRVDEDRHAVFDPTNNWTGFLIPDGQSNALRFNTNNKWDGLVIW